MIFLLFSLLSLFTPSASYALTCLEQMSQEVIDPDEANLAADQIAKGQRQIFSSIYPSLYYEMNLAVIDCSSKESMKVMGSDIIPYLNGEKFFSGDQDSGISTQVLHFNQSAAY